ncbi:hypothetical protein DFH08DRAFT_816075 [Mycena albidolilacea]|uniref:Uncharacterized protein n=1 Tax=Mycena albidolilacea TaxID=1033008 RepID=A0AAD7EIC9_9AGAR|nr:hypothetical protein DFH08DRAFT_816075 [Mycena albidolilacea]
MCWAALIFFFSPQGIERQYFTEPCAQRDLGSDSTIITSHFISNSMLTDIQGKEIKPEPAPELVGETNEPDQTTVGIVTVRPGGRTAPKPAVQWTVRRRYGRAGSLTTPDGTGRWTGRPSTVDGRGGEFYDAMEYSRSSINLIFPEGSRIERIDAPSVVRSRLRLSASGTQLEGNECGNQVGDSPFILCIFTAKAARYVDVVMNLAAKRQTPKTVLIHQHISPSGVPRGPASRNEGWEAGPDGHGTVAASSLPTSGDVAERCSRPSIRPRVDGTPVLTTVRRRDGGLRRPIAQRRDGTVVRPSVRPTVLDGQQSQAAAAGVQRIDSSKNMLQWQLPVCKGRQGRNVGTNEACAFSVSTGRLHGAPAGRNCVKLRRRRQQRLWSNAWAACCGGKNCAQVTCLIANEKAVLHGNRESKQEGVNPRGRAENKQKEVYLWGYAQPNEQNHTAGSSI